MGINIKCGQKDGVDLFVLEKSGCVQDLKASQQDIGQCDLAFPANW